MTPFRDPGAVADVCIVGFGFAGLATAAHLVRDRPRVRVTVIGTDTSGLGLAYGTRDTSHRLNVRADRMGAWADGPGDFARWLATPAAGTACAQLGIAVPGPADFAPRALYGRYLRAVRDVTLGRGAVELVTAAATALRRTHDGWLVEAGEARVRARCCVLAIGHEPRTTLDAPGVHRGPWSLPAADLGDGPALIAGTGLTAVDSILTLRGLGFRGEIVAASRSGLLPRAHADAQPPVAYDAARLASLRCAEDVRDLLTDTVAAGHDWRAAIDGLRPHTQRIWRQLSPAAQRDAARRWGALWSAHRHRMAPDVGARIAAERAAGTLRVVAGRVRLADDGASSDPWGTGNRRGDGWAADTRGSGADLRRGGGRRLGGRAADGRVPEVAVVRGDGGAERLRPSVVVDCTGATVDWTRSVRPLVRRLVADGHVVAHPTGLGVRADADMRIGPELFAVGSALTGELWESVAVPELREQAATVAAAVTGAPLAAAA